MSRPIDLIHLAFAGRWSSSCCRTDIKHDFCHLHEESQTLSSSVLSSSLSKSAKTILHLPAAPVKSLGMLCIHSIAKKNRDWRSIQAHIKSAISINIYSLTLPRAFRHDLANHGLASTTDQGAALIGYKSLPQKSSIVLGLNLRRSVYRRGDQAIVYRAWLLACGRPLL